MRETEALSTVLINAFGTEGFMVFKVLVAVLVLGAAFIFDNKLRTHSDFTHSMYFAVSVTLVFITLIPVVNNLLLLGWI